MCPDLLGFQAPAHASLLNPWPPSCPAPRSQAVVQLDAAVVARGGGAGAGVLLLGEHKQTLDNSHMLELVTKRFQLK